MIFQTDVIARKTFYDGEDLFAIIYFGMVGMAVQWEKFSIYSDLVQ